MSNASNKAVFLSYASQDAEAAGRICDAMRAAGLEVWFDKNELVGGDAWDQKIRKQIKDCALFVPVISANTQARPEGYFRLEWKLAVDRSHLMADDQAFIVPVVIDDTPQAAARVPEKFQEVQWTRLVMTETPSAFAQRLNKLLTRAPEESKAFNRRSTDGAAKEKKSSSLLWTTIVPLIGIAMGVAFAFKGMWGGRSGPSRPSREAKAEASAPALSEARQLIKRARELSIDKYNSTADDFAAAELLIKQALEKGPTDAEVWAFSALFNISIRTRGFDHANSRNETARSHAERALSLNADSIEGLYALGRWQRDNEPDPAVAEASFKKVLAKAPDHDGALLTLAIHYMRRDRFEDALPLYERAAARPALKPLAFYNMFLGYFARWKFAEAERCIRESIAAQPSSNSLAGMAMWQLSAKGDAPAATAALNSSNPAMRKEPRSVWIAAFCDLARRAPDDALVTLQRLSDDFIQDNWFVGPKAYWMGRAHALAGRPEAARVAWEAGLEVVRARLAKTPDNLDLRLAHGELLALLGRTEEAVREAKVVEESLALRTRLVWTESPSRIYAALGRADDALRLLPTADASKYVEVGWPLTVALMRIDPLWDRIRDDPAFQKRLATASAAEAIRTTAVEWPRDPELKRVFNLVEGGDANAEDFVLAEEILKTRVTQNPTDADATIVMARLQNAYIYRGFDRSESRAAQARRFAERATQLAPDNPEAIAVHAVYLFARDADPARAREMLDKAIALKPSDPFLHRFRDNAMFNDAKVPAATALASAEKTAELFPSDALAQYELARRYRDVGRIADMERQLDRSIAIQPIANPVVWKARIALWVRGDVDEMFRLIERVPERTRTFERVVFSRWVHAMVANKPEEGLAALRGLTSGWIEDFDYTGPKALLAAQILEQQGKRELARVQYEAALEAIRQRQNRAVGEAIMVGNDTLNYHVVEAWILMGLGRKEDAKKSHRIAFETARRPYRYRNMSDWWFTLLPISLVIGERESAFALMREAVTTSTGGTVRRFEGTMGQAVASSAAEARSALAMRLKLDPRMAPFRDDPEIVKLLTEPAK